MLLGWLLSGLLTAWLLSLIEFDRIVIKALQELMNIEISEESYYFIFAMIGVAAGIIHRL